MPLLFDYIPDGAIVTETTDRIRTTLRVSHYHGLKRLIASMPGVVPVVGTGAGSRRRRGLGRGGRGTVQVRRVDCPHLHHTPKDGSHVR